MAKRRDWFAPKRYGYGAGFPIAWQGWALLAAFVAALAGTHAWIGDRPLLWSGVVIVLTIAFIAVVARRTRGGWRWRPGRED